MDFNWEMFSIKSDEIIGLEKHWRTDVDGKLIPSTLEPGSSEAI